MRFCPLCAWSVALCATLAASEPPNHAAGQSQDLLHAGTKEVVLDMIVRDKHGHLVKNLRPDEVQVSEDGARQTIKSFRFVSGDEQLQAEKAARAEHRKLAAGSSRSKPRAIPEIRSNW